MFLKQTVDETGRIAWRIVVMGDTDKEEKADILFQTGEREETDLQYQNPQRAEGSSCNVDRSGNILKVRITGFDERNMNLNTGREITDSADLMAGSVISVLDLRGNGGGYLNLLNQWITNYDRGLGNTFRGREELFLDSIALGYFTSINEIKAGADWLIDQKLWIEKNLSKNKWHVKEHKFPEKMAENSGILFVLMDKGTASVSERLILSLLRKENVVLVGTPSAGRIHSDYGMFPIYLKHTGLKIRLPNSIVFYNDESIAEEGTGILPDLWCGEDSSDCIEKIISYYKIVSNLE